MLGGGCISRAGCTKLLLGWVIMRSCVHIHMLRVWRVKVVTCDQFRQSEVWSVTTVLHVLDGLCSKLLFWSAGNRVF